ncbi:methyltransferase domain-containing protein [Vaginella massiliensis]|uniref:methyltransferase domain-containing protein n=1 Tax=Vaginella massiliensis TaxID=1816680 RepID=UPI003751245F
MKKFDAIFWDERYRNNLTQWDARTITTPLQHYIDQLEDQHLKILIPGCGNAHEAEYLVSKGFRDITLLDYSLVLVEKLKEKFKNTPEICIVNEDFFDHEARYDLILEQTFFCSLHPTQRNHYVEKIKQLLKPNGKLVGVLFGIDFGKDHPPFGGTIEEYRRYFENDFEIIKLEECHNSIKPRKDTEIFINLQYNTYES